MDLEMKKHSRLRRLLTIAALTAGLLFAVPSATGEDRCQRRIIYAEHELHEAIEDYGYYSRPANHWRHELHEARERCWREHQHWWNEHEHRWHHDRDWDDHDHDRD
jgi:hypothetical protein